MQTDFEGRHCGINNYLSKRISSYLLLIAATALWGIGGPIVKHSFGFVSPFEFLFWRFLIASIISVPILIWFIKKHPLTKNSLWKLLILGLFATPINLGFIFLGLERTTVVEAVIIGSLTSMFVAIAGSYFLLEALTKRKLLGIILAISGVVVAVLNPLLDGQLKTDETLKGNVLLLLGGISWVIFVMLSKKWEVGEIKPFHVVASSFFQGFIVFYLLFSFQTQSFAHTLPGSPGILGIIYMAVFGSLIAFSFYELALSKIEASETDLFSYLGSLWAIPLAIFWLGEKFDPALIISSILIVLGVGIAEFRPGLVKKLRGHHLSHHK